MFITIVICTRNRATSLQDTLDSILNLDTKLNFEALIVDNASNDETRSVIESYSDKNKKIKYHYCSKIGLGAARDVAWRLAKPGIISFTDDDCILANDYIDKVFNEFKKNPNVGMVGGRIMLFNHDDARVTIDERIEYASIPGLSFVAPGSIQGANFSTTTQILEEVNGLNPKLGAGTQFPCEDIELAAKISWANREIIYSPQPTVFHNHGRKERDIPALMHNYDKGRGAYFAIFLHNKASRKIYISAWQKYFNSSFSKIDITSRITEILYGYKWSKAEYGLISAIKFMINVANIIVITIFKKIKKKIAVTTNK